MSDTVPTSRAGTQFGPYRLLRLLGRGGMGEVYEAHDTVKDRTVALKLMSQELNSDEAFRRRMRREAHTAGRLQEPHVVPIHDFGEIDGQLFIDMRFIEGTDLSALLRREESLSPPRAVAIISQIAEALDAAHRAGVVHRDIKPENILITGNDFAYLVDFGIAAAATDQHLTKTGHAVGSWSYMAPERFGDDEVTYRSDIYGLACVLYECLTGTTPYPSQNLSTLVGAHLNKPIPRPSLQRQGIPTAFDEVIARGMAKDPGQRHATAGELARAAQDALSAPDRDRATTIIADSERFPPPPQSGPMLPSSPLPSGPMPSGPWTPGPPPPWHSPPARKSRRGPWLIVSAVAAVIVLVVGTTLWLVLDKSDAGRSIGATTTTATRSPSASTSTAPATAPTVTAAQLESFLLSARQIDITVGTTGFVVDHNVTEMTDRSPQNSLSDEKCLGALIGFQTPTYKSSGYTGMFAQLLKVPNADPGRVVVQGAVLFTSADQANAFIAAQAESWRYCAGKTVTQVNNGKSTTWTFRELSGNPPNIALQRTLADSPVVCQHNLAAVSNVVFDVNVCGPGTNNEARLIANQMGTKVPR
ncbi:serine/threonine protein kinase [Mycobacterium intermedium]|uniref:non-specific serine/threonine protein kinase n=1 Tax=Mycobacterium intermedium TaxID=28445 RepID=A0A1E3SMP3_MYCIE|nr:serine/threonine-protein kinase PknH/PknJ [Mycobacterium intermedium]MCV6967066.1 sensor domain-containing protein [Mycobacterium intermedium]ODR03369.1 serine/threonine protein kinase [Mycobacterium intermedium]OPE52948.1 serine/threonine protein kinase [Mycobacterium intermedium]ORB07717.1 serine/threonine protein kinase [Mycobacterium intermedium]